MPPTRILALNLTLALTLALALALILALTLPLFLAQNVALTLILTLTFNPTQGMLKDSEPDHSPLSRRRLGLEVGSGLGLGSG